MLSGSCMANGLSHRMCLPEELTGCMFIRSTDTRYVYSLLSTGILVLQQKRQYSTRDCSTALLLDGIASKTPFTMYSSTPVPTAQHVATVSRCPASAIVSSARTTYMLCPILTHREIEPGSISQRLFIFIPRIPNPRATPPTASIPVGKPAVQFSRSEFPVLT